MQKTRVQFLGQEDPLEKEMATHSNILAWKIPWTEEPGGLECMGLQRVIWLCDFTSSSISETIQYFSFCLLISFNTMPSSFIHVVTIDKISFFFSLNYIYIYTHIYTHTPLFFIHSSVNRQIVSISWLLEKIPGIYWLINSSEAFLNYLNISHSLIQ